MTDPVIRRLPGDDPMALRLAAALDARIRRDRAAQPPWMRTRLSNGWVTLSQVWAGTFRQAAVVRACQNDRDHAGGDWCPGWLTFRAGDPQAACDTCGAWCGVRANSDPACPRQDGWSRHA